MPDPPEAERLTDVETLAVTLYGESRGESLSGRAAVGCVIRNRAQDGRWPVTIKAVCLQPKQFSCWNNSRDPNAQATRLMASCVANGTARDPVFRECLWLAQGICDGYVQDHSRQGNHYLTEALYRLAPPKWARGMRETALIGNHIFLKG